MPGLIPWAPTKLDKIWAGAQNAIIEEAQQLISSEKELGTILV